MKNAFWNDLSEELTDDGFREEFVLESVRLAAAQQAPAKAPPHLEAEWEALNERERAEVVQWALRAFAADPMRFTPRD